MYSGELVGLHMSGVNALKEKLERLRDMEDRGPLLLRSLCSKVGCY
jgi:hypothetical protein